MPKGYSNKTGLPHKMPRGNVFAKGNTNGNDSFKGQKHTPEAIEKMRRYQLEYGVKSPYRFRKGHTAYNKTGESKEVILRRADKKWKSAHPEAYRKTLLKKYGLTLVDFDRMLKEQGGNCAVCLVPQYGRQLSVDHDHTTGKVRGLLCNFCNTALGMARDNPEILGELISYLLRFQ